MLIANKLIRVEYPNREVRLRNVQSTARPVDWKRPNQYPATKDLKSVVNYQLMKNNTIKKDIEQQVIDNYYSMRVLKGLIIGSTVVLIALLWVGLCLYKKDFNLQLPF